jgi:flagellum-specific peptidoglycan hydrolase FlgJ
MKLYQFDNKTLQFKKINNTKLNLFLGLVTCCLFLILGSLVIPKSSDRLEQLTEYEKVVLVAEMNKFSEDKFVSKLKELNFKFPYIVYAQSLVETGGFTSHIFRENHNLFGMKEAKVRLNLAKGTQYNHAYYDNWEQSVMDYALYASSYLKELNTEDKYFQYLSQNYAEDPNYVSKLRKIIQDNNLKQKFQ